MTYSLSYLAEYLGAELQGDSHCDIDKIAPLTTATSRDISFLANNQYVKHLATTNAAAVLLKASHAAECPTNALILKDPYLGYAKLAQLFDDSEPAADIGIHPTAVVADDVDYPENIAIGAYAVIESGVTLGAGVRIGAHCSIGKATQIGEYSQIFANTTVYARTQIGQHCVIHSNSVIGADGFGWANEQGKWIKIAQLGRVVIGDHVDIGAGTTIDRGALGDTIIHDNVIIDNQVQIGHNVEIGAYTAIAGCTTFAGSSKIGQHCIIGGASAFNGHIEICDGAIFTGMSMVPKSVSKPGQYSSGVLSNDSRLWKKSNRRFYQLDDMYRTIKKLERELNTLKDKSVTDDE